jgi:hypothetical protein
VTEEKQRVSTPKNQQYIPWKAVIAKRASIGDLSASVHVIGTKKCGRYEAHVGLGSPVSGSRLAVQDQQATSKGHNKDEETLGRLRTRNGNSLINCISQLGETSTDRR